MESIDPSIMVFSTSNPWDAVERLIKEECDCVVLDYSMPEMNGIELAKIIVGKFGVPAILYTGRGSEELAQEALGKAKAHRDALRDLQSESATKPAGGR